MGCRGLAQAQGHRNLVIAAGPELAFDEIPGLGPAGGFTLRSGTTEPVCERIVTKAIGVARIKS